MRLHRPMAVAMAAGMLLSPSGAILAGDDRATVEVPQGAFRSIQPAEAKELFNRIARLEGRWRGKSTKGWTDEVKVNAIAGRSAVVFDSFDAHQDERMLTLFTMDGDELVLTHFCAAGNQPRLRAEQVSIDGTTVWFRFVEGGNMASRDLGHMDALRLSFRPDGGFTEQWTWYQKGSERWMEEITHQPITDSSVGAAKL